MKQRPWQIFLGTQRKKNESLTLGRGSFHINKRRDWLALFWPCSGTKDNVFLRPIKNKPGLHPAAWGCTPWCWWWWQQAPSPVWSRVHGYAAHVYDHSWKWRAASTPVNMQRHLRMWTTDSYKTTSLELSLLGRYICDADTVVKAYGDMPVSRTFRTCLWKIKFKDERGLKTMATDYIFVTP